MPLLLYRFLLPVYLLVALPGWVVKMGRRGGFGSGLRERFGLYRGEREFESCGATHVHAVSVGEALLALKLIRAWRQRDPERRFVLAVATATGHAVARDEEGLRVVYQPIDPKWCVRRYLDRFEPERIVLVEGEMWPNLMALCERRGIPVALVNARMSPRSRSRYRRFAAAVRPVFSRLDRVALQEPGDAELWRELGVAEARQRVVGSLKFDPGDGAQPQRREAFAAMLDPLRGNRAVVLAASTHAGEERLIAMAIREAGAFPLIVPRHAERRREVKADLEAEGFRVALRSGDASPDADTLVVDTTGELRDWTAHADGVVIGKSFLGTGGQNPAEAVLAGKPLIFGPHMENFEPLAGELVEAGGALRVTSDELAAALGRVICRENGPDEAAARRVLERHAGAVGRTLDWLLDEPEKSSPE